jgi:hypothetical protein
MLSPQILEISEVVFRPFQQTTTPKSALNNNTLPFPSSKSYYGDRIPVPVQNDTMSLQIWYSMKSNDIFPLKTVYAQSRIDQEGRDPFKYPASQISFSMKGGLRQYPDTNDWIYYDRFELLLGQIKGLSNEEFLADIYLYPFHKNVDSFLVARLLEDYIKTGNEKNLRRYLATLGVTHLEGHNFNLYPLYFLFFLLTRFVSYPMTEEQIQLSNRRAQTERKSPERIFIDSIFHYPINNIAEVLSIVDLVKMIGPKKAGKIFQTDNPYWVHWGNEYLFRTDEPPRDIPNLSDVNYIVAEQLYTWTDNQIKLLCKQLNMKRPFSTEYNTRRSYIQDIGVKIQRFKANPVDAELWKRQTSDM